MNALMANPTSAFELFMHIHQSPRQSQMTNGKPQQETADAKKKKCDCIVLKINPR